jgi:hypothetical protein
MRALAESAPNTDTVITDKPEVWTLVESATMVKLSGQAKPLLSNNWSYASRSKLRTGR